MKPLDFRIHEAAMEHLCVREMDRINSDPSCAAIGATDEDIAKTAGFGDVSQLNQGTMSLVRELCGHECLRKTIHEYVNPQLRKRGLPEYQMHDETYPDETKDLERSDNK